MAKGLKTGGRKPGTPNKYSNRTRGGVAALLDEMGVNPIEGLALIATDENHPIEVRRAAFSDLARYTHPQLKAVQHSGGLGITQNAPTGSARERILAGLSEEDATSVTIESAGGGS